MELPNWVDFSKGPNGISGIPPCRLLGINSTNVKLSAFALGAMFAASPGCSSSPARASSAPTAPPSWNPGLSSGSGSGRHGLADGRGSGLLIMVLKPTGVMGSCEPTIRLHKKGEKPTAAEATETPQ